MENIQDIEQEFAFLCRSKPLTKEMTEIISNVLEEYLRKYPLLERVYRRERIKVLMEDWEG